ncbi:MAG: peroxide stress protein YaaA [Bacteroidetes bacterium 4572_77]|nr:MAG: peroxide stress protein YaaA [Bacteroidetes bacterium 4572_77]
MICLISPAKTLDFETAVSIKGESIPFFGKKSQELMEKLKEYSPNELQNLLKVNPKIAYITHDRFAQWQWPSPKELSKQALLAFKGEVFRGIDAYSLSQEDMDFAQKHLAILSGLYGILRPLDHIMPYRIEMGTKWKTHAFKNLYDFWGDDIHDSLQQLLQEQKASALINLASKEYFKVVKASRLSIPIITPIFKEFRDGELKSITIYAKKARGLMCRYIIQNKIEAPEKLKFFDSEGYYFSEEHSSSEEYVFVR